MSIIGLTHEQDGRVIQRLSVSTKIAIGLPADEKAGRKHPMKLDHFIFLRKPDDAKKGTDWQIDPELTKHYGDKPRSLELILIDDDIENVFPTQMAWWTASQCKCWGNGLVATRRTEKVPDGETWTPCGQGCKELDAGLCKPSGDLRCMLADFPQLGAVSRIHTTSYRSIQQIHSSLQQIQVITGGRLAGIRATIVVRPEKTSYESKGGERKSTTIYALSLEIKADGIRKLVGRMTETARLFEQTRKMLGAGQHFQVVENDDEKASELEKEFYRDSADEDVQPIQRPSRVIEATEIMPAPKKEPEPAPVQSAPVQSVPVTQPPPSGKKCFCSCCTSGQCFCAGKEEFSRCGCPPCKWNCEQAARDAAAVQTAPAPATPEPTKAAEPATRVMATQPVGGELFAQPGTAKPKPEGPYVSDQKRKKLITVAKVAGVTVVKGSHDDKLHQLLKERYNIDSMSEIPETLYDEILKIIGGDKLAIK